MILIVQLENQMKFRFSGIAALLCLLVATANALPPSAAVFPMQARGVDSNSVRIIEDALANSLMQTGKLRLLERSQMEAVLREQGFQESGACEGSECAIQVGKLLGIQQAVVASLGLLGRTWVLNARLVNVGTGEILASSQRSLTGEVDHALTNLVPKVAADLTRTNVTTTTTAIPSKSEPAKVESKSSAWLWWTLGGATVVAGAAVAALMLTADDGTSPPAPGPIPPTDESTVPVEVTLP